MDFGDFQPIFHRNFSANGAFGRKSQKNIQFVRKYFKKTLEKEIAFVVYLIR
jgi:hypothetical protein